MDKLMLMNDQLNAVVWGKYMIFFYCLRASGSCCVPDSFPLPMHG